MKRVLLTLILAGAAIGGYYFWSKSREAGPGGDAKQQPLALKKHSADFNQAVGVAMNAYFEMTDGFVNADTGKAKEACRKFIGFLDLIPMEELKTDTLNIYDAALAGYSNIKSNAQSLLMQTDITEMRKDLSMVSENLYPFFRTINYEGEKMYWQNCPMAFGDDKGANWISQSTDIINPYLGKNHPQYKGTMLHCGELKDTIKAK